jgi:MerR family transcriptional regulator, aldehyde-responsive regulator
VYTISKVSELTGLDEPTIKYYETAGLLSNETHLNEQHRSYSQQDVTFLKYLTTLKNTGMSLENMVEYFKDGSVLQKVRLNHSYKPLLEKQLNILMKHMEEMLDKKNKLEKSITMTQIKIESCLILMDTEMGETSEKY